MGAEDPDELYRQGRFAEAEKIYAGSDMDHPNDLRYRYNRGCASYQNSDFPAAVAAFSSVLRRAKAKGPQPVGRNKEMVFRAAYNLGNAAFKQGDFSSAVEYYRQAALYNPENEDARHNMELALRELERQKGEKPPEQQKGPQKDSQQRHGDEDQKEGVKNGQKSENQTRSQDRKQAKDKTQDRSGHERESEREKDSGLDDGQGSEQESPKDLSGELTQLQAMPEEEGSDQKQGRASETPQGAIDKKKAQALLDNITEDRSRFLRFQIPKGKRDGVRSGKDW